MIQNDILALECFQYYVERRSNLLQWLENRDNYKKELQEALDSIPPKPHFFPFDKIEAELREKLNNLPELERQVRFDLEVLENAPVRREFEKRIPEDCANLIALNNIEDILFHQEATTIEEAIEIYRNKNCPDP